MNYQFVLLEEAAAENPYTGFIMIGLIGVVFYLFMIRPQIKRTKEAKRFRENLSQGDKVVTIGGINGKVLEIAETTVLISTDGTKLRIEKSAISSSAADQLGSQQR